MNISPIQPASIQPITSPIEIGGPAPSSAGGGEFHSVLESAIGQVENARSNANQSVQNFLSGEGDDLHSTVLAVQRADLEFDMLMQVRNKVISAYQEIMRMQM
ncbi:MAG TPA: flagellar hook-basal body complex protein FliE [Bryobacteraceae bacterium]|jgi:flagellar hook-basal body complex protein FliE|nr:flagellar hook-basal body complex protein FliE [Bryobacteraceae bacterium]